MSTRSAEWFDVEYNNRARVPDFAGLMGRWAQASALVREQTACVLDVPYGDAPLERPGRTVALVAVSALPDP